MNEFSCMIVMVFGAAPPARTPSAAEATPSAVDFRNCRREPANDACSAPAMAISLFPVDRQEAPSDISAMTCRIIPDDLEPSLSGHPRKPNLPCCTAGAVSRPGLRHDRHDLTGGN